MAPKKVLLLVGEFCEGLEVYFAVQALQLVGHQVDSVCPGKAVGEQVATAVHDFEGHQTYTEKRGHNYTLSAAFEKVDVANYDGLYIPGGRGPEYIRLDPRVLEIVRQFDEAKKPIASLCHGPQVLVTAGVLKGRTATSYKAVRPDLELAGANFKEIPNTEAVVDGNLVTGVDWMGNAAVLREFLKLLGSKIEA